MSIERFGPFTEVGGEIRTGVEVKAGDILQTISRGFIDFGGFVINNADGEGLITPPDYPAPSLRKNSLLFRVGHSLSLFQGGTTAINYIPDGLSGELILRTNDRWSDDNSMGWSVTILIDRR